MILIITKTEMDNVLFRTYRSKRRARRKLRELRSEHREALETIDTIEERRSELVEKCLELTMEKEALAEALIESKTRLHQATDSNREGPQRERDARSTNDTQHHSIVVSNLFFAVVIYLYIYFVCHVVLSSDHQIWLILNNLVAVQILYMCVSVYASSASSSLSHV